MRVAKLKNDLSPTKTLHIKEEVKKDTISSKIDDLISKFEHKLILIGQRFF
jgi:hypothetical protein